MKIASVRVREVHGTLATDGPLWEERLVRPIDVYPTQRAERPIAGGEQIDDRTIRLKRHSAAQSPIHTPLQAGPVKWNEINVHFLKRPLRPRGGSLQMPDRPGVGMELGEQKIQEERDVDV